MRASEVEQVPAIAEIVSFVHRQLVVARTAESVLVGLGGMGSVLAAALWSGWNFTSAGIWIVASACGVLFAVTFSRSNRTSTSDTARDLDAGLDAGGALLTAFESSAGAHPSSVAALLEARVAAGTSQKAALRSILPFSVLPLVAPFVGAALLALARDTHSEPSDSTLADLTTEISNRLFRSEGLAHASIEASQEEDSGVVDPDLPVRLRELARSASTLLESPDGTPTADLLDGITRIEGELQDIRSVLPPTSSVDRSLREASTLLDAARMRIARGNRSDSSAAIASARGGAASSDDAGGPAELPPITLSTGDLEGPTAKTSEFAATDSGWWLPEFDSIVTDWIDRSSRASGGGSQ